MRTVWELCSLLAPIAFSVVPAFGDQGWTWGLKLLHVQATKGFERVLSVGT